MLPKNVLTLEVNVDKEKYNLNKLKNEIENIIIDFIDEKKVKFKKKDLGPKHDALLFSFIIDEEKTNNGYLEKKIGDIENVKSVEVVDVKRIAG